MCIRDRVVDTLHVLVVNVVVGNDCGSQDSFSVFLYASVNHLFNRYGSSKVDTFNTPLFYSSVLNVDDLTHTYGVFVFADSSA